MTSRAHSYSLPSLDVCKRQAACNNLQSYTISDSTNGQHLQLSSVRGRKWHWSPPTEKSRWETLRDVPCWNQLRQRETNCGFMMNEALKIAQGTRDKRITPSRYGNSIYGSERRTEEESTLTIEGHKRTQEEVSEWTENNLKVRRAQSLYYTFSTSISYHSHINSFSKLVGFL